MVEMDPWWWRGWCRNDSEVVVLTPMIPTTSASI